ncbi:MAG: YifB family Mg chelatase-like AAA ATPase [Saccharofermentans sp.]|nr:YifB family Mg chelatase-like AAA ATPase [Saccharofermentans sp.]
MATMVKSFSLSGIEGYIVDVGVKIMDGMPSMSVIGMGDKSIQEASQRVESAIDESGYVFPKKRIIINLAPSSVKKNGSHFDLAMAVGVLYHEGLINAKDLSEYGLIGELSLDGKLRGCKGVLSMIITARNNNINKVIVPLDNVGEASLVKGIKVIGLSSLTDVIKVLEGKNVSCECETSGESCERNNNLDFSDVIGQDELIDALVIAAAGGHNMLMLGEPGCGKTMVAQRIPTILPQMSEEECLEVTKIYSIAGILSSGTSLIRNRPFRAPHHNVSLNALIGGGNNAMPGEVSLAHNGVLFLDEMAEFSKHTLDALRQPVEDKKVTVSRVNGTHTFPANFMFVTAMNPCPCGYFPSNKCKCTDYEIIKYRSKISGPIMDRIDIQKQVKPVDYFANDGAFVRRSSSELRDIVERARKIQQERYLSYEGVNCNAQMNTELLQIYCALDNESKEILKSASEKYGYSARVIHKLLRLARTSADICGHDLITPEDVVKVISLREMDRSNSELLIVNSHRKAE